jgi:hypothetical protein
MKWNGKGRLNEAPFLFAGHGVNMLHEHAIQMPM